MIIDIWVINNMEMMRGNRGSSRRIKHSGQLKGVFRCCRGIPGASNGLMLVKCDVSGEDDAMASRIPEAVGPITLIANEFALDSFPLQLGAGRE